MTSLTFQISLPMSLDCAALPFTVSVIAPLVISPDLAIGVIGPIGADWSTALPISPRTALLLGFALQVTARHVEPNGVAEDVLRSIGLGDVLAALTMATTSSTSWWWFWSGLG